jgi:hypothetical protein
MENEARSSTERQEPVREDVTEETQRRATGIKTSTGGQSQPRSPVRRDLRRALSSRRALREAILLHEILGPPKGTERSER